MARTLGAANVGVTRSMRRALFNLRKKEIIQKLDIKAPHSYRLSTVYLREGPDMEFNPRMIGAIYACVKADRDDANRKR